MGRRQKLKQGDPVPLEGRKRDVKGKKRKAVDENVDADVEMPAPLPPSKKSRGDAAPKKSKGKKKQVDADDDEDDQWGGVGGGVQDEDDFKALDSHAKFQFEADDEGDIGDIDPSAIDIMDEDDIDEDDDFLNRGPVQELEFSDDDDEPAGDADDFLEGHSGSGSDPNSDADSDDAPITGKNIEAKSRALDLRAAKEAALNQAEANADQPDEDEEDKLEFFDLPTAEEREAAKERGTLGGEDVKEVLQRIQDCAKVLDDFKRLATKGRSRSEYVEQLLADMASYYGYNDYLTEKLFGLFSVPEAIEFFEANEVPRPVTIRTNTLRTRRRDLAQALINRGVTLEPLGKWTNVGLQVFESSVPVGATPEYLAGHYMLQAASSFLPVMALQPQPDERILDMASAPGGKATYVSALMRNTGVVFANDANAARTKSLTANVHRLGCKNVVVCSYDGREFPRVVGGFDRVLLDAPCSGTGVISKDPSVKMSKSEKDFQLLGNLQRQLILCAIDSVNPESKTGGVVVYSTCSVTVDENESVVDYALRKRPHVTLVDTGLEFGVDGFQAYKEKKFGKEMKLTKRYYPHVHNMDGFFVAKLKVGKPVKRVRKEDDGADGDAPMEGVQQQMEMTGFEEEEDKEIIQAHRRKHLLKTKGIKLRPKAKAPGLASDSPNTAPLVSAH